MTAELRAYLRVAIDVETRRRLAATGDAKPGYFRFQEVERAVRLAAQARPISTRRNHNDPKQPLRASFDGQCRG
jgi:hypothetical protein